MNVSLTYNEIDINGAIASLYNPQCGAVVTFIGTVRNQARGKEVISLEYSAYEEMALFELKNIVSEAINKFSLDDAVAIHRLGKMSPPDVSVFIGVASAHRKEAFDGGFFIIDAIKKRVPIWKKEIYSDGSSWIEEGRPDETI